MPQGFSALAMSGGRTFHSRVVLGRKENLWKSLVELGTM